MTNPVVVHDAIGDLQRCTCAVVVNAPAIARRGEALIKLGQVVVHETVDDREGRATAVGAVVGDAPAGRQGHGRQGLVAADRGIEDR